MAFTEKGYNLAASIAEKTGGEAVKVTNLKESVQSVFKTGNVIVFVGAVGIAVRGIASLIVSKTTDPAVIVVDELGRFVVPILSGHIGGGNEHALKIAGLIGATPVITTATDINDVFAIDVFAAKKQLPHCKPADDKTSFGCTA